MRSDGPIGLDFPAVHSHLAMLQQIIGRLAGNCASAKTWCVSIASALAVVMVQTHSPDLVRVAAIPVLLFGSLDAYYLGLERRFRTCYEDLVKKLHNGTATTDDLYVVMPKLRIRGLFAEAVVAVGSFSIWPFYLGLAAILWLVGMNVHGSAAPPSASVGPRLLCWPNGFEQSTGIMDPVVSAAFALATRSPKQASTANVLIIFLNSMVSPSSIIAALTAGGTRANWGKCLLSH